MTLSGRRLAGDRPQGRPKDDFYPTPSWATEALLKVEKFRGSIWEPAAGNGAMSDLLGSKCLASDIKPRKKGVKRFDFLKENTPKTYTNIITNPPFKYALEFVQRSKEHGSKKIAMFLKIQFLEGVKRQEMFLDKKFPLSKVWVFSRRVTLWRNGKPHSDNKGVACFAWYVWDKKHKGPATIGWL